MLLADIFVAISCYSCSGTFKNGELQSGDKSCTEPFNWWTRPETETCIGMCVVSNINTPQPKRMPLLRCVCVRTLYCYVSN